MSEDYLRAALREVVKFLDRRAGDDDMASVKINNEGRCFVGVGMNDWAPLTTDELVEEIRA